ncbi:MAG TPA: DUF480 domain-containing protein [Pirellulales bacterium]|nr:DUF480 domain-containing protein [Pirellulales bacterium]
MSSPSDAAVAPAKPAPRWQPLSAIDRRVLGVLVEKAKTTPDVYPMTINGICAGANQKSNRHPLMHVDPDDVEEALGRLRALGAVALIEGSGRATKYRHFMYDWLGVDKVELAVMAELLLRGAQTEGELRGRAARMEPIDDLTALRPVLASLKAKRLVIPLTPDGRGHVVSHALYPSRELEKLQAEFAGAGESSGVAAAAMEPEGVSHTGPAPVVRSAAPRPTAAPGGAGDWQQLRGEVAELRGQLIALQQAVDELSDEFHRRAADLDQLKDALGA